MADPLLTSMLAEAAAIDASLSLSVGDLPLREQSRGGGFSLSSGTVSRLFSVVKIDCNDSCVCFGRIGVGSAFCIRSECSVKSHVDSKMPFRGGDEVIVVIEQTAGSTAFVEPMVKVSQISPDVWSSWVTRTLPLKGWCREFQAVAASDNKMATTEDIKEDSKFFDNAETFKTPAKRKRDDKEDNPQLLGDLKSMRYERVLPADKEELENFIDYGMKTGLLTTVVAGIESNLVLMGEGLEEVAILTASRFESNETDASMLSGTIQNVKASIGSTPPALNSSFVAPTLWGTVAFIADEVMRVSDQVKISVEAFSPFKGTTQTKLGALENNVDASSKLLQLVMKTMARLAKESTTVKEDMVKLEERLRLGVGRPSTNDEESVEVLMNRLGMGGRGLSAGLETPASRASTMTPLSGEEGSRPGTTHHFATEDYRSLEKVVSDVGELKDSGSVLSSNVEGLKGVSENLSKDIRELKESAVRFDCARMLDDVRTLKEASDRTIENFKMFDKVAEDVNVLKVASEVAVVKFGNLGIRNLQECSQWVEENFPPKRYGILIDPLILLDRIYGNDEVDPITHLKEWESRQKLNIDSGSEQTSLTSMSYRRPRMFHSGRPSMSCDQNTSCLNKLKKHTVWKTGGDGMRNQIFDRMNELRRSMAAEIDDAFAGDEGGVTSKGHAIANMCLSASVTFITQLCNYVDTLFEKLHVYSKFTVETGWGLTMQVLDRIMEDLYAPKEGVANSMRGDWAPYVVLSSLRTHDVAQVYINHNFENHPAVSSEFIKFLATNSGFEKVEKLTTEVEAQKSKLALALLELAKCSSKADTASTKASEAERATNALKTRLAALEGGGGRGNGRGNG